jgi:hypothetical protein
LYTGFDTVSYLYSRWQHNANNINSTLRFCITFVCGGKHMQGIFYNWNLFEVFQPWINLHPDPYVCLSLSATGKLDDEGVGKQVTSAQNYEF